GARLLRVRRAPDQSERAEDREGRLHRAGCYPGRARSGPAGTPIALAARSPCPQRPAARAARQPGIPSCLGAVWSQGWPGPKVAGAPAWRGADRLDAGPSPIGLAELAKLLVVFHGRPSL